MPAHQPAGLEGARIWRMAELAREPHDQRASDTVGEQAAAERLVPLVYEELRRLAHAYLAREATGHTLTTTDLVHQAYLHLAAQERTAWKGESHFQAVAATAIRRILVDHARSHRAVKRGGALRRVPLEIAEVPVEDRAELLVALDEALERLARFDARQARIVECRFFAGLTEEETAEIVGVSIRTVKRDWTKAKAWLYGEIFTDA